MAGERGTAERVAGVLQARIVRGELAPGDRLPSTRALVADFGVATATASRVHALLRARGLARTVPGVGTLVAPGATVLTGPVTGPVTEPSGRALHARAAVHRAVRVADVEGLAAVTIRRVAADLALPTMTLHRAVGGKEGLLRGMTQEAVGRTARPAAGGDWRQRARSAAAALWRTYRRHPWLAETMGVLRPVAFPAGLDHVETMLAAFADAGLGHHDAFACHIAVLSTLRGFAVDLEIEADATARTGRDAHEHGEVEEQRLLAALADGSRPHLRALVRDGVRLDVDALAMGAVERLLDGVAAAPARVGGRGRARSI